MKPIQLLFSFAIAALPLLPAGAQTTERAKTVTATKEAEFVEDVIEDNLQEIAMLKLGLTQGTDPEIKAHAEHMLAVHYMIDSVFREYGAHMEVEYMGKIDQPGKKSINAKTSRAWDEEWADEVADMHRKMISRFEMAQGYVRNEELKAIVDRTLPILREHRDMAIAEQRRMADKKK
ncbi:MAG: hypothetical protein K0R82_229 [Flavipsychrobacter sp.]|nr:hypothetical protein [Flavipsychrobacter sp.]